MNINIWTNHANPFQKHVEYALFALLTFFSKHEASNGVQYAHSLNITLQTSTCTFLFTVLLVIVMYADNFTETLKRKYDTTVNITVVLIIDVKHIPSVQPARQTVYNMKHETF